jgi:hypothetical protein
MNEQPTRKVTYEIFRGAFATWDRLFSEAATFADRLGEDRLISISHSEDKDDGIVVVWYWDDRRVEAH